LHCFVPHLHTVTSCVRSGYYIHNTASFRYTPQPTFHYIPAVLCLSPLVFSEVAPSHSHRGWLRYHFALNQVMPKAILYFFPAVSRSYLLRFATYLRSPFASIGGSSIAATPPLHSSKNNNFRYRYNYHFLRCLEVFDCRFHKKHPRRCINKKHPATKK
jgi:hypothetical protein